MQIVFQVYWKVIYLEIIGFGYNHEGYICRIRLKAELYYLLIYLKLSMKL